MNEHFELEQFLRTERNVTIFYFYFRTFKAVYFPDEFKHIFKEAKKA